MRNLAVKKEKILVSRLKCSEMKQDAGENITGFVGKCMSLFVYSILIARMAGKPYNAILSVTYWWVGKVLGQLCIILVFKLVEGFG